MQSGSISIDAKNIMPVIKRWLYSDKDIFIREMVSNGCDAITKYKMTGAADDDFRVTVTGEWSQANDDWAKKSIESVKNVRSVLDTIIFNSGGATIPLNIAAAVCGIEIEDEAQML